MDASLSDYMMPILVYCLLGILINAGILWLVMNVILGSRGDGPFWKCLVCSLLLPVAIFIAILLPGRGMFTVMLMCILGGVVIRMIFDVNKNVGLSIFVVFMLTSFGFYFVFDLLGIGPGKIATKTAPKAHAGMTQEQYRDEVKAALMERLEGEYNVGFDLPDDSSEELRYAVRAYDGHAMVVGSIDKAYKLTLKTTPRELADWVAANAKEASGFYSPEDYLKSHVLRGPVLTNSRDASAPGSAAIPRFFEVPDAVAKFLKNEVAMMTPTTATVEMMKDWRSSGAEGLTSATATATPTAWELALSAQDLAAYRAAPDPRRTKQEDHRSSGTEADEENRVSTMINETFVAPAGEIEIMVEVHREERTAAEDVYGNKLRLPAEGKTEAGVPNVEALIPALTRGGDHYVSLYKDRGPSGARYRVCMEGFYKNIWYRIKAPVQPTAEQTAQIYRLMNMQKLKITRMLES